MQTQCGRTGDGHRPGGAPTSRWRRRCAAWRVSFATFLFSPGAQEMFRVCIAEAGRFPELGAAFHASGPARAHARLVDFFDGARARGELAIDDPETAAEQFTALCKAGPLPARAPRRPARRTGGDRARRRRGGPHLPRALRQGRDARDLIPRQRPSPAGVARDRITRARGSPHMPDPITIGSLVAAALAAGAAEAGKAVLGQAAKDAYDKLKSAAARVLGAAVGRLEKKPESDDLAAVIADDVAAQPAEVQAELRALAEALKAALAAEGRAGRSTTASPSSPRAPTPSPPAATSTSARCRENPRRRSRARPALRRRSSARPAPGATSTSSSASASAPTASPRSSPPPSWPVALQPPSVTIDTDLVVGLPTAQGYVSPADAAALRERLARTEADLDALRRGRPRPEARGRRRDRGLQPQRPRRRPRRLRRASTP